METPFQKVSRFIERHAMLDSATGVVVAVSGGPDSVVLLDIMSQLISGVKGWGSGVGSQEDASLRSTAQASTQPPTPNTHLHVAHLDHCLRDRESAQDAEFVRSLANGLGLECTIERADVRAAASARHRGVEETAREIRYDFLRRVAEATGCNRIAVGHTMTDQAETFVMRLIRGSGTRGLAAMRPVMSAHIFSREPVGEHRGRGVEERNREAPPPLHSSAPLLIRPLLCIDREEVEEYCRDRRLEFREDTTNRDLHYARNRVRSEIMPMMEAINPRAAEALARAAENLAADDDALERISVDLLDHARIRRSTNEEVYCVSALLDQPSSVRRRMILQALRLARSSGGEISSVHVSEVESLLGPHASGKRISLPGGIHVWREFDALAIKRSADVTGEHDIAVDCFDTEVDANDFRFKLERGQPGEMRKSVIEMTQREKKRSGSDWMSVALVDGALPERLIIRTRRSGERAHVVGQRQTKKLKSIMIDHRIPSSRRADWPIVATPDGKYIWSPGLPPAQEFAARDESKPLAILRASSN